MNRLIAYRSSEPERLRTGLRSHPGALPGSSGSDKTPVPGDGAEGAVMANPTQWARWGVGFYVGGEALVQRWSDEAARGLSAVLDLRSNNLIAQARVAGVSDLATQTSTAEPPFRFRRFSLAVQGDLSTLSRDRVARAAELPDFLRNQVRGPSDAEAFFYQFLLRLHEADPSYLSRADLPAEVAVAALGQVLYAACGPASADGTAPIQHAALSNGRWLVVARRGPQPMWYRALIGLGGGDDDFRAILAIADTTGEGRPGDSGLVELPDNYALMVGADVDFQILPLSL
jgi:hypothetical protein